MNQEDQDDLTCQSETNLEISKINYTQENQNQENKKENLQSISQQNQDEENNQNAIESNDANQNKSINQEQIKKKLIEDKRILLISLFSVTMYLITSVGMTLINKIILSKYQFKNSNILIFWQQLVTVVLMNVKRKLGYSQFSFKFSIARKWILANILFVFMLSTSGFSLQYLSVPMVAVLKNFAVVLTACGDKFFFGAPLSGKVKLTLLLMIGGGFLAGYTDLEFSFQGYFWMTLHIISSGSYVLYIRYLKKEIHLTDDEMVYYNNVLSLPIFIIIAMINEEWGNAINSSLWSNYTFIIVWVISGLIGMMISLFSFMCMSYCGPTSYAVVGSLNKVPLTIFGFVLLDTPITLQNVSSVSIGIIAGLIYSKAKYEESQQQGQIVKGKN